MKIKDMLAEIAILVQSRDTIDHGSIRCLYSEQGCREIEGAEGCDEVYSGEVGDDDLAEEINQLIENPERLIEADPLDLACDDSNEFNLANASDFSEYRSHEIGGRW